MNYNHTYHAGSAADVFKHCILIQLLKALRKKDKPFFCLDTHAGQAIHRLTSAEAQQTNEYHNGIAKLWRQQNLPKEIIEYLQIVDDCNSGELHRYPGSTYFIRRLLRSQDRLIACDKHPQVAITLKKYFTKDKQVQIFEDNGYQMLKALLPPSERRGLVFIDPPYEDPQEYAALVEHSQNAYQRWQTGIYALWYPIKDRRQIRRFHERMIATGIRNILISELCVFPDDVPHRLSGSGMLIINPPWQLDKQLQTLLPSLLNYLRQHDNAHTETRWLQGE